MTALIYLLLCKTNCCSGQGFEVPASGLGNHTVFSHLKREFTISDTKGITHFLAHTERRREYQQ